MLGRVSFARWWTRRQAAQGVEQQAQPARPALSTVGRWGTAATSVSQDGEMVTCDVTSQPLSPVPLGVVAGLEGSCGFSNGGCDKGASIWTVSRVGIGSRLPLLKMVRLGLGSLSLGGFGSLVWRESPRLFLAELMPSDPPGLSREMVRF